MSTRRAAGRAGSRISTLRRRPGRVRRLALGVIAAATVATALPVVTAAPAAAQAGASNGSWTPVENWPLIAIHAALDRDGRVVTYGTDGGGRQTGRFIYDRWTPGPSAAAGHETLPNTTRTDLFCSLQLNRPDTGEMLLFGGDNFTGVTTTNTGNPDINSLSPDSGQLTQLPGMQRSRWYATGTTLPDGRMFIQGGDEGADHPEVWSPERGAELLPLDTSWLNWWYPKNFVLPDGRIFGIDNDGRMYLISADLTAITPFGQLGNDRRGVGTTAVMYQPGRILHFGGSTNTSALIDVTSGTPVVTAGPALSSPRKWVNSTILPDGRVLATGGARIAGSGTATDIGNYQPNNAAEVWDPRTNRWTLQSSGTVARMYHSTGLLLADGRVLVAGGGAPGPITNTNAEIFSPDYLVTAGGGATPRPAITSLSSDDVVPGEAVSIGTSSPAGVARVTLVKTGSVTHSINMEQRLVELPFSTAGGTVTATVPVNSALVTPGFYLLSVIDGHGVPSSSEIIRVGAGDPNRLVSAVDGKIARLYRAYFLRQPDAPGFRYWRQQLIYGFGLNQISTWFSVSAEFRARYGNLDDAHFVDQVYRNVMGREPDPGGRAYWIGILAGGVSRGAVMTEFSESPEFVNLTGTPPPGAVPAPAPAPDGGAPVGPSQDQISRLYLGYFSRPPDEEGLGYWVGQAGHGVTLTVMSNAFAASAELQARYGGTSDDQFIDLVYRNVMGREPDADGRAYWLAQMAGGFSRGLVMIQFTESPEFVTRSASLL